MPLCCLAGIKYLLSFSAGLNKTENVSLGIAITVWKEVFVKQLMKAPKSTETLFYIQKLIMFCTYQMYVKTHALQTTTQIYDKFFNTPSSFAAMVLHPRYFRSVLTVNERVSRCPPGKRTARKPPQLDSPLSKTRFCVSVWT